MMKEIVEGNWNEIKGKIMKKWGYVTHNDLTSIKGNLVELRGLLQKKYQYTKAEAEAEIVKFCNENDWS